MKNKLPKFKDAIEKARKAGACEDDLEEIEKLGSWKKFWAHKKAPRWAYWYAYNVIRGRWPEAYEDIIMGDFRFAILYICNVEKLYWPEGEAVIVQLQEMQRNQIYAEQKVKMAAEGKE
ncbi:MAG: hypothetical protein JRI77_18035 [Deltaproteobacteria bacterium]|nr:hypothetical protein [Deltaproteobacteria bacterium]